MKPLQALLIRLFVCVVSFQMVALPVAFAAGGPGGLSLSDEISGAGKGSEYVSGATPGAVLMKVNLWGAIQKSGIHHVPARTDLLTLLSYAGGPSGDANMDQIRVRRMANNKIEDIEVDLDQVLGSKAKPLVLEPNDVIIIPQSRPTFSQNTVNTIAVVAGFLSIVLAGIVIRDQVR